MRTSWVGRVATAATAMAMVLGVLAVTAGPAGAATCTIAPQLRDVTINQGLGSYSPLAAGKTTLVRTYFSLPSCAGNGAAIEVRGATLTVTGGTTTNVAPSPLPTTPYAQVATYTAAPALDSPADLKFVVPPTALSNATNTAFTATFSLSVTYGWKSSGSTFTTAATPATFTTKSGSSSPITASVGKPANNLRILVVPVGNAADTSGNQYPAAAVTAVQNGMTTLSRVFPVRDGVGDLATAGNGIRYTALPTLLDAGPNGLNLMTVIPDGSGIPKFCIKGGTWATLKGALAQQLQAWNSANPNAQAERVVGAVWQGVSGSGAYGCNDGLSTISSPEAVIRIYPEGASPSTTGGLLAHELEHTMGGVTTPPGDNGFHSLNQAADGTSPNRDYNVTTRQFLGATDRSITYPGTTADNVNGLLEQSDYALVQCTLTPGTTVGCPLPGSAGTAASGPAIVISGSSDGTVAGTSLHSYFDTGVERSGIDASSQYTLVQFNGATQIGNPIGLRAKNVEPTEAGGSPTTATRVAIDVAVQLDPAANSFQVRKGGTTLYTRALDGTPTITATRDLTVRSLANFTNAAGDDTQPALTADGTLLAWVDGTGIRVQPVDKSAPASAAAALPGSQPSWSQGKDSAGKWHLLFTNVSGAVHDVTVNTGAGGATFTNDKTLYNGSVLGLGNSPGSHASYNAAGTQVVLSINDDLWRLDFPSPFTPNPISCALSPLLGSNCTRIISTGAAEKNPSVSASNLIAYEEGANIRTANLSGAHPTPELTVTDGSNPTWGGAVLGFVRAGNIRVLDGGNDVALTTAGTDTWPALDAATKTVALDRTVTGQHDVFVGSLDRDTYSAVVTDDQPGNLRFDVFVDCSGTLVPVGVGVAGTATSTGATLTYSIDPSTVCNGGQVVIRVTDGWQTASTNDGSTGAAHAPVGAIYSPPAASTWLQFDAIPVSGLGLDIEDKTLPDANLSWSLSGPGSPSYPIGTGRTLADQQPPANGWAVGTWTVTLTVTDNSGMTSSVSVSYVIEKDSDHDGWKASLDKTCGGADGDSDPTNANADYDNDAITNRNDAAPCTSANNASINFDPDSLNTGSSGTPVTIYITFNGGNLNTVPQRNVKIVQIANITTNFTAISWCPTSNSTATAQFDRTSINNFLIQNGLKGMYVPFVIQGSNSSQTFTFRGVDATSPITS